MLVKGRLFELYEGRHTLSILNPFFLGFDTDVAFGAQVGPVGQENDQTKSQAGTHWSPTKILTRLVG